LLGDDEAEADLERGAEGSSGMREVWDELACSDSHASHGRLQSEHRGEREPLRTLLVPRLHREVDQWRFEILLSHMWRTDAKEHPARRDI